MTKLGSMNISDDAATLVVDQQQSFLLDEQALSVLARYLKVPYKYLNDCPPDFRAQTLKFWRDQKPQADVALEVVGAGLVGMYPPGLKMLPTKQIGAMVERVFEPEDEVRQLERGEERFRLDVTSRRFQIEVPNPQRIPGRPEIGDITCGGVRFLTTPNKVKAPSVMRFFERIVCTNGQCASETEGKVSIKGLTVPEIIASMEEAAQRLLGTMDEHLDRYRKTAEISVPGHPVSFAEQLGVEAGIPQRVLHTVLDHVRQLPEQGATVYDVQNAFTAVANQVSSYSTKMRLQTLGGEMSWDTERLVSRCGTCERLLV